MSYAVARKPRPAPETRPRLRLSAEVLRCLLAAAQGVGRGFPAHARWMADFANADLASASPATLNGWRWQAIVWALADPPDLELAFRATLTWSPLWHPHDRMDDPSEVVLQLQSDLRGYLAVFLSKGRVTVKPAGEQFLERQADGTVVRRTVGSARVAFFTAVCDVLVELGPRLRVCDPPTCGKYVAAVGHYRYCSPACSQRVRTRRFAEKHGQRKRTA